MKTSTFFTAILATALFAACGESPSKSTEATSTAESTETKSADPATYDPKRGEGKYTSENLALAEKLDAAMAKTGENVSNVKCTSCHKITDEKLVGPGWKDVTKRRTPEWLMNFITNPDPMIDKDPEVQAMLELCLVRMPNQSLTEDDSRAILEYMRQIDGVK